MPDAISYESGTGFERIDLSCASAAVGSPNGLFSWEWGYDLEGRGLTGVSRVSREVDVDIALMSRSVADRLRRAADRDVSNGTPGRLVVNGAFQRCHVVGFSSREIVGGACAGRLRAALLDGVWRVERTADFSPAAVDGGKWLDLPHGAPYDLACLPRPEHVEACAWAESPVRITVFGPCTNPAVVVGGNSYQVDVSVPDGGYLVVDPLEMKVFVRDAQGNEANALDEAHRGSGYGSGEYIFQPIPPGTSEVSWDNSFSFTLGWYEEEGVPPCSGLL